MKVRYTVLLILAGFLFLTSAVRADTMYVYTGNALLVSYGPPTCGSACGIHGDFTVATTLGDNLSSAIITTSSFSFTDGDNTFSSTTAGDSISLSVSTNSSGGIVQWNVLT